MYAKPDKSAKKKFREEENKMYANLTGRTLQLITICYKPVKISPGLGLVFEAYFGRNGMLFNRKLDRNGHVI